MANQDYLANRAAIPRGGASARPRAATFDPLLLGLVPTIVIQGGLFVLPMAIMFLYSFWTTRNFQLVPEWTLANYLAFFQGWTYPRVLGKTIVTALAITALTLVLAYPMAYYIVRYTRRWQRVLVAAVILSFWTSGLLRAYAWMAILGHGGIINKGLMALGVISEPLPFLLYNIFAVILVMTYFSFPFAVITIYTSLEKMDFALVHAASDLGASPVRAFLHVTLPLTMPGVVSAAVLTFVPLTGMFFVPLLVGGPGSVMIAPLIANQMQAFQFGLGAAMSFIVAVLVMGPLALAWRYLDLDRLNR
ncbi:MAG TPA: ABC transporter permease [Methylomirabilota bacterium]|jgi:spermidine/putrescine transport system permease protein|nr:ABC transporter permease [Methylomirabilota bacterium]